MDATNFPSLLAVYRQDRFTDAVATITDAIEAGTIFNVDFVEAKRVLDRAVEEAAQKISKEFLYNGNYQSLPENVQQFSYTIGHINGLYNIAATQKKIAKCGIQHPFVDALRALTNEVAPLAAAVQSLKDKIVKGRKPNPEAAARKAAKAANAMERATCACCFGDQAVLPNGLIHDHGYRKPRHWHKSGSCPGRQFQPLEVSDAGLHYMIKLANAIIANSQERLEKAATLTSHTRTNPYNGKQTVVTVTDPSWERIHREYVTDIESTIRAATADRAEFTKVLADWKPKK